ncbi:MAG: histone H1 [Candidatus Kapabacteria bacterium]|nr:histone H1 [Candidatus Kapabacteria bacterium]MBX7155513.1 histone H1 [Bacteroidota bacterium]
MNRHEQLQNLVASMAADFDKFYGKGNKAAGTRVRAHMQELRKVAQDIRAEVQTMKSADKE